MFKLTTTTAALTAALTLTAFGNANGFDTKAGSDEQGPAAPHIGDQPKGHIDPAPADPVSGPRAWKNPPSLGDRDGSAPEGETSRSSFGGQPDNDAPKRFWESPFDNQYDGGGTSGAGIGIEREPGLGHGHADGTSGGPLGNEFEKPVPQSGFDQGDGVPVEYDRLDIDADGHVDFMDLVALLSEWGHSRGRADLTGDGAVDMRDLAQFLSGMPAMVDEPATDGPTGSKAPQQRDFSRKGGAQKIDFGH